MVTSDDSPLDETRDRRYPHGMTDANNLPAIADRIRETLKLKNAARDAAVNISRELIRFCSLAIRAAHRDDWDAAERLVGEARRAADELGGHVRPYPDLYFTGYTQDAFKELAEAHITIAIARGQPFPQPEDIGVEFAAYLNGLAESAGELRRRTLDKMRAGHSAECERLLGAMDDIYDVLVGMDFPDALTGGLRRNTDMVRGVLERTRGELSTSFREAELKAALDGLERKLSQAV